MTDLPFGRGGSPLQNLISRGIYETKISAALCTAVIDGGPVYMKRPLSLHGTAQEIFTRATEVIEGMIVELVAQEPLPEEQRGEVVTFARRTINDGDLANVGSMRQFYDRVRMLDADGYPAAFLQVGQFRLEFSRASLKGESLLADVRITKAGDAN